MQIDGWNNAAISYSSSHDFYWLPHNGTNIYCRAIRAGIGRNKGTACFLGQRCFSKRLSNANRSVEPSTGAPTRNHRNHAAFLCSSSTWNSISPIWSTIYSAFLSARTSSCRERNDSFSEGGKVVGMPGSHPLNPGTEATSTDTHTYAYIHRAMADTYDH